MLGFFFFSSRRRHTRYWRDWSSDVCSSDLIKFGGTSVGSGAAFARAAAISAGAARERPVAVVVSAMSGTTDTLLGYADATSGRKGLTRTGATREGSLAELYRTLAERHLLAARGRSEEHTSELQ